MKAYVATSWKNAEFPGVVDALRRYGFEVYDFRDANRAFNWAQIDPSWDRSDPVLGPHQLLRALEAPEAAQAFRHDKGALDWCDFGVLVMPCGRSAHLEAGYLIGQGKSVFILLADKERPDLMHLLATPDRLCTSLTDLLAAVNGTWPHVAMEAPRITVEGRA